ncbi:DUF92 domain-containing protein [Mucilaginibacter litoreus]|uniref:DUF92 domain-containing protein n=1 Tax=Mucilaginibacter litoreus TaxID=1048221 RepID=A0ABW3ASK2_9SPHI
MFDAMTSGNIVLLVILLAASLSYKAQKLTLVGALTGVLVAVLIYLGSGIAGIVLLTVYFLLSTWATSHKKQQKKYPDEGHPQIRDAWQVLANGGIASLCGLAAYCLPEMSMLFRVLVAAALSAATADTLSSELGTVYGSRFYNILSWKQDTKGRDGVISLEGSIIGITGSGLIALTYAFFYGWNTMLLDIILAGTAGNLADSVLGAALERKGHLNNNAVNLLNTLTAVIICCILIIL